jgi:DNA-directed RNA polymerase subunit RPC12/RpoP
LTQIGKTEMSMSAHDRKILWTKAGNRCSYHYGQGHCDEELVKLINGKFVLVGDECHIVGEKTGSPRYVADFPQIDSYKNRILMCKKHHKIIDDNESVYTIELLSKMKQLHEESIAERIKNQELEPLVIKDSVFRTVVERADEAIGMEVNRPAQFQNVKSELIARDVKSATGFKTNQNLNAIVMTCSNCGKIFPFACTDTPPRTINCPYCGHSNILNTH